jgi:hypothetical protein
MMLYRHGDVLIASVPNLPAQANKRSGTILARGEITGHSHRVAEIGAAQLYDFKLETFLEVGASIATLVHEEHKPIKLPKGIYRVWMQREYTPAAIVQVRD